MNDLLGCRSCSRFRETSKLPAEGMIDTLERSQIMECEFAREVNVRSHTTLLISMLALAIVTLDAHRWGDGFPSLSHSDRSQ